MQIDGEDVFTAADTARKLGISPTTLRVQRKAGRISGIPIGRDYVYSAEEIRRYQIDVQGKAGGRSKANRPAHAPRRRGARDRAETGTTTTTTEYDHPEKQRQSS